MANLAWGNPRNLISFSQAYEHYQSGKFNGVGIVFLGNQSNIIGLDLDNCRDKTTGEIKNWAIDIVKKINSYTEISPSGTGLRIFLLGTKPSWIGSKVGDFEVYPNADKNKFLTVTGHHLHGTPLFMVKDKGKELEEICLDYWSKEEKSEKKVTSIADAQGKYLQTNTTHLTDNELIEIGKKTCKGFNKLWNGDTSGHDNDDSAADLALCNHLAYLTWNDPYRIDSLFRQSGLYREKWERKDYREKTIQKAIKSTHNFYNPNKFKDKPGEKKMNSANENKENKIVPLKKPEFKLSELGNAERLVHLYGDCIRHCHELGWLVWDGKKWVLDKREIVRKYAHKTAMSIPNEVTEDMDEDKKSSIYKHAARSVRSNAISSMITEARPYVKILAEELDQNRWLLNCQNGTLDLLNAEFDNEHQKKHYITKIIPASYNYEAKCPNWEKFIYRIMEGDQEIINFLQEIAGISLTGDTSCQSMFILWGSGCNGKSTFLNTMLTLLGNYGKMMDTEALMVKKSSEGGKARPDLVDLKGKRFVIAIETEENKALAESLVKQLTGEDEITARPLYSNDAIQFKPELKLWLATNHKPRISGTDKGIWRRIKLIPFTAQITEEEIDPDLPEKLLEELDGILKWCIEGLMRWLKNKKKLVVPEKIKAATDEYRAEMDLIGQFLEECCSINPEVKIKAKDLYSEHYKPWCLENEISPTTSRTFNMRLKDRGFELVTGTGNYSTWKGLGVKS